MLQPLSFTSKTALITGASQGIGLAVAKTLAAYGATVWLAARSASTVQHEADLIRRHGGHAFAIACDVSRYSSVQDAVHAAMEATGRLDILVNNAGVIEPLNLLVDSDPEIWGQAADINYKGVYHGMRAAIPGMLDSGAGCVVNMSSGAANSALEGWSHYCSGKAAAQKLTEVGHKELGAKNIRVVGLSPGTVATGMMKKIREAEINGVSHLPWSAHIAPEWVGEAVAFLCGPEGSEFAGSDFSLKTPEGRRRVGLPLEGAPDANE